MQHDEVKVHEPEAIQPGIELTPAALTHFKAYIAKQGHGIGLRLSVKKMGCSGLGYVLEVVDTVPAHHVESPIEPGFSVYVDKSALFYVKNTRLDFVKEGINQKVIFQNPNEKGSCGCGESFTVSETKW